MHLFKWVDKYFSFGERLFIGGTMLFTSLLLLVNVVMRYLFHNAIYWAEELVRYLMVWLIFLGGSQVVKHEGHIAVDVVLRILSPCLRKAADCVLDLVGIAFCLVLAYFSYIQTERVFMAGQVSPAMEMPMWLAYGAVPTGSLFMAIRYGQNLWGRFRGDTYLERRESGLS
jgi:C4-dicarboxylate transporter DctQ subunit|tara:strand:- start:54 stop:566 length:513 start_codon:yes stop_codon:yes gene_type:complete